MTITRKHNSSMLGSEKVERMEVKPEDIQELLEFFAKNTYKAKDTHPKVQSIMQKCLGLFAMDYNYTVLPNNGGELSTNYPSSLVILESEKVQTTLSDATSSAVTTPCNGTKEISLHVDNGITGNHNDHIMDDDIDSLSGRKRNGDGTSPSPPPVNSFKTEEEDLLQSNKSNMDQDKMTGSSESQTFTRDESDLNSVFIETNDFHLDLDDDGEIRAGVSSSSTSLDKTLGENGSISTSTTSDVSVGQQENGVEFAKLKELCSRARFARCRARFPIPVILFNQKHICRSATLSGGPEIYGRSSFDYLFSGGVDWKQYYGEPDEEIIVPETQSDWQLFDRVRSQDIRLLKAFQVQTIVDLMVEKKKVKFGVNVTSSEKVDKENRYSDFTIVSLPYPGCEFFKKYRDNGYNGEDLIFEWNQTHVDANIFVPADAIASSLKTDWSSYRKWDLIGLTQNYLKLLLTYLRESENGLLIHCISGWDRTPLFVSLLRLSLWADGVIHKSLSAEQILYLTLAYDWLLFGHNLEDRLSKGEEILFFCFYFLKYIISCEYNVEGSGKEVPKSQNIRARNDSDVQLDGVLLEGGSLTSPGGSSWSLSSCSSSSSKSMENPPVYFNVEPESWDDSLGIQHLKKCRNGNVQGLESSSIAHGHDETDLGAANKNFNLDSSTLGAFSSPVVVCDGFNGNSPSSVGRPNSSYHLASSSPVASDQASSNSGSLGFTNGNSVEKKQCQGKTSPVAVPRSNRSSHHRHESSSSASIGSWQFITGTGSLRETISSSDPGSSHSHPSRLSLSSAIECIEASESSCTLVEELTPVEFPDRHPLASFDSNYGTPANGSGNCRVFSNELEDSVVMKGANPSTSTFHKEATVQSSSSSVGVYSRSNFMSKRRERLQTVRAHFYTLYAAAIGFQFKNVNDNGSGGGLGSIIGNFASKVGIRSAHRHMS